MVEVEVAVVVVVVVVVEVVVCASPDTQRAGLGACVNQSAAMF